MKSNISMILKLKEHIRINPDDAEAHKKLAKAYESLASHQEAVQEYEEVIRINPDDGEAHSLQGLNYSVLRKHKEAIQAYKAALHINPDDAEAHSLLGANYDALDNGVDAIVHKLIAAKLCERTGDVRGMFYANKSLREFYTRYGFNPEDFGSGMILGGIPFDEVTSIKSKLDLIRSTLDSIYSEIISIKSDVSSIQDYIKDKS